MEACPECSAEVQQIGEWSFCLECNWDDLPRLPDKGGGDVIPTVDEVWVERLPSIDPSVLCYPLELSDFPERLHPVVDLVNYSIQSMMERVFNYAPASGVYLDNIGALCECVREVKVTMTIVNGYLRRCKGGLQREVCKGCAL